MPGFRLVLLLISMLGGTLHSAGIAPRAFSFAGVTNRFITPNGDGKNDVVRFLFDNPRDAAGTLKIYGLRGHLLASVPVEIGTSFVEWNARSSGAVVPTGIYIYVLTVEKGAVSGSVVVIR